MQPRQRGDRLIIPALFAGTAAGSWEAWMLVWSYAVLHVMITAVVFQRRNTLAARRREGCRPRRERETAAYAALSWRPDAAINVANAAAIKARLSRRHAPATNDDDDAR